MVPLPSVPLMLLLVARAAGPGPAALASVWAPALAVLSPSVLLMLLLVARATGPGPVTLAAMGVPVLAVSAARLPPSVRVAAWAPAPAMLLPMVPGL